ncbi:GGDEF domain-containing protein [Bradyrhizobium prioriisuperbiae]|uniref:GGDEF domain-containing protein n=1 Tax=Bradyrhizobium prioriisuperbiae TaxID=2854389 RepID=UPI0028E26D63|nr:GGDEF domain-containing protein [Bradyrhizobium prioritasuperba]
MTSLRLRKLYRLAGWITAAGCLLLGGLLFAANLDVYQRDRAGARELQRFHLALLAANMISAERGPANSRMGAGPATEVQLAEALDAARRRTDESLAALENALHGASSYGTNQKQHLDAVRVQLRSGRDAIDTVSSQPQEHRDGARVRAAIETMFTAADRATSLRDDLGQTIIRSHPSIGTEVILSTICSSMREYAGRLGSYVVMMLASSDQPNRELYDRITSTEGRLTELRALASNYASALRDDASVRDLLAEVDRQYFMTALPFARHVADNAVAMSGQMSLADFTRQYVPGMAPVEALRELISRVSQQRVLQAQDRTYRMLVLTASLMLSVWVVLLMVGLALHHLLFKPLMVAREQVIALAQDILTEPPRRPQGSEEMAELFDSLQMLREQQRIKKDFELDQEKMAARLKRLSETDPLTGLLNRRALDNLGRKAVAEADRSGKPLALIMFDLDYFKSINDTYGHGVGDVALKCVAAAIQSRLRIGDSFARHGGEEFVVLVQADRTDEGRRIAESLLNVLRKMVVPDAPDLTVTASFGVAVCKPGSNDWDSLVAKADRRLYLAKRLGRNRVCVDDAEGQSVLGISKDNRLAG